MKYQQRILFFAFCLMAAVLSAALTQADTKPRTEWTRPLPSLDKIEECRGGDLSRSYGSTISLKLYDCRADVTIDSMGRITAFEPDDAEACERVMAKCGGWAAD